jgi:uncharacterized membrane protein
MDKKVLSIVSYVTIIGWIVAFIKYKELPKNDQGLVVFHLRQSFGLSVLGLAVGIVGSILASLIPFLGILMSIIGLAFLALMVIGILNSSQEAQKTLPVVGPMFATKFDFIQ